MYNVAERRKEKGNTMNWKKVVNIPLIAMLLLSVAMVNVAAWDPPHSPPPYTWLWVDDSEAHFYTGDPLNCTQDFNVTVNINNASLVKGYEFKLEFNNTLINATAVYASTAHTTGCTFIPGYEPSPGDWVWTPLQNVSDGFVYCGAFVIMGMLLPNPYSGPLMTITFHIIKSPPQDIVSVPENKTLSCNLTLFDTEIIDTGAGYIDHDTEDGYYEYIRPQITAGDPILPDAPIWLPLFPKVCDDVTVDGSGTDANGAGDFITLWQWTIANVSGSAHWITADGTDTRTFHCDGQGNVEVTLYVEDNENQSATKTYVISQTLALGPEIDLFTQTYRQYPEGTVTPYDGKGPNQPADSYAPGENVSLWAYVTYNGEHVQNILVGFEVIDPNGDCVTYRVDRTNETGYAQVWFRLPIPCDPAEQEDLFGHYWVIAKCKLQDDIINDTMSFKVGFIIEIPQLDGLETLQDPLVKMTTVCFNVTLKNIAWVPRNVTVIVVVYDECDVPLGQVILEFNMPEADDVLCSSISVEKTLCIYIPKWAYVGVGKVYANAFTDLPQDCGIPYCPEVSIQVPIAAS